MPVFAYDVTVSSHALLRHHVVEAALAFDLDPWIRVIVSADDEHEAEWICHEMASMWLVRWVPDVMVTGIYPRF